MAASIPDGYFDYVQKRETGGEKDPLNAQSKTSSASGPYQFTDSTSDSVRDKHPELNLSEDWTVHPTEYQVGMRAFTQDNANALAAAGHPVDTNSLYLAHHYGLGGAMQAYAADPNSLVSDVFPSIIAANPDLRGKRIKDITGAQVASADTEDAPALSAKAQTGNGILSLLPGVGRAAPTDQGYDWRNNLGSAFAALVSGTNPEQAAALNDGIKTDLAAKAARQKLADGSFTMHVDPKSGKVFRIDGKTGQVTAIQGQEAQDPAEEAYRVGQAKNFSDLNTKIAEDAQKSQAALGNIDTVRSALADPNVYQGAGGEYVQQLKKVGQSMGFDVQGVNNGDVAQALLTKMVQESRTLNGGMPGSLSDRDVQFLKDANAGLNKTPEANARILDIYQKVHQANIERNADRVAYTKGGKMLDDNFNTQQLQKYNTRYAEDNAAFKREQSAAAAAPRTTTPTGPLKSGAYVWSPEKGIQAK